MSLEKIEKFHSAAELILAVWNHWCDKHQQHPDLCGATEEFREKAGEVLKGAGILIAVVSILAVLGKR